MKAILVIDFGEDDIEDIEPVHLSYKVKSKDLDMGYYLATKDIKLKPLPQKKVLDEELFMTGNFRLIQARFTGWNDCIDEILGGKE